MQNFKIFTAEEPQPATEHRTSLADQLSGKVRFIKARIEGRAFFIGAEDDEPQVLEVRFA